MGTYVHSGKTAAQVAEQRGDMNTLITRDASTYTRFQRYVWSMTMHYALECPPLRAPVSEHAEAVTLHAFCVSFRTMERWGFAMTHSQAKLSAVARQLNEQPRKTLGYETPAERFNACVASTC